MTRRVLELDTLSAFDAALRRTPRPAGWFVQGLDLAARSATLLDLDPRGAVFLGCTFAAGVEVELRRRGALVFPRLPDLPFDPYRPRLYDWVELYGDGPYAASPDAAVYAWSRAATSDLDPRQVVGVMGGHALRRDDPRYADAARLSSALTSGGRTLLTGGGPGAMEAANLGGYLSPWAASDPAVLTDALALLAAAPCYTVGGLETWVDAARKVRLRWPGAGAGHSLSIPTWFYGHEPTNVFATGIAKYFTNALREDTLLHPLPGRPRLAPWRARDRPGGVPGRHRGLLGRRRHGRRPAGAGGGGPLDDDAARLAAAATPRRGAADGRRGGLRRHGGRGGGFAAPVSAEPCRRAAQQPDPGRLRNFPARPVRPLD